MSIHTTVRSVVRFTALVIVTALCVASGLASVFVVEQIASAVAR